MLKENLITIYKPRFEEMKGFYLRRLFMEIPGMYSTEKTETGRTKQFLKFNDIYDKTYSNSGKTKDFYSSKKIPDLMKGNNYKFDNIGKKLIIKVIPLNIKTFYCDKELDLEISNNGYEKKIVDWSGKDKKYGIITPNIYNKEKILLYASGNIREKDIETRIITQRIININEKRDIVNVRFVKEIEQNTQYISGKFYVIYNLPENDWETFWENQYFSTKIKTVTEKLFDLKDKKIEEDKGNLIYNCQNEKFQFASTKTYDKIIIKKATENLDLSRLKTKYFQIKKCKVPKIVIPSRINLNIEECEIGNIENILRNRANIKSFDYIKNENVVIKKIATSEDITLKENKHCGFGDITSRDIYMYGNSDTKVGNIYAKNDVYFRGGEYTKIGTIYFKNEIYFSEYEKEIENNKNLYEKIILPNELNIRENGEKNYGKRKIYLGSNIERKEENKPLTINIFAENILLHANFKSFKNIIINLQKVESELEIFIWNGIGTVQNVAPKKYRPQGKFDVEKYFNEMKIKIYHCGKKLKKEELEKCFTKL